MLLFALAPRRFCASVAWVGSPTDVPCLAVMHTLHAVAFTESWGMHVTDLCFKELLPDKACVDEVMNQMKRDAAALDVRLRRTLASLAPSCFRTLALSSLILADCTLARYVCT